MKIIKLLFKNINSLKDEHVIDFNQSPLVDAGLFLIAGPTGSGKSTILDVITLALYNEIPRFGTISKNNVISLGSIITHHTKEAYAEVLYQSNNRLYASKWSLAKNRNDNFNDYHMELWDLTDQKILDFKKGEIPDANAKIIGLNYNQFVKSILLSQGEFAQFLKASHGERSELLEKITGTEIYRRLGKAAFEKHKIYKEKLENERSQIALLSLLTDEEIHTYQNEIVQIDDQAEQDTIKINALTEKKSSKESYDRLLALKNQLSNDIALSNSKVEAFKSEEVRMLKYESLAVVRSELALYNDLSARRSRLLENEIKYKASINNLETQRHIIFGKAKILLGTDVNADDIQEKIGEFENKIKVIDDTIFRLKKDGEEVRRDIAQLIDKVSSQYKKWYKDLIKPDEAIASIGQELSQCQGILEKNKIDENENIGAIVKQNETSLQSINMLKLVKDSISQLQHLDVQYKDLSNKILQLDEDMEASSNEVNNLNLQKLHVEQDISRLRKEKEEAFAKRELSDMRDKLIEGEPCPLCGALDHPYCIDKSVIEIGNLEVALHNAINNEKEILAKIAAVNKKHTATETQIVSCKESKTKIEKDKENLFSNLQKLYSGKIDAQEISAEIDQLEQMIIMNREVIEAMELFKTLKPLQDKYVGLNNILKEYVEQTQKRNSITKSADPLAEANELRKEFQTANNLLVQNEVTLVENNKLANENNNELIELEKSINSKLAALNIDSIKEANSYMIDEAVYAKMKADQLQLIRTHEQIKTKLDDTAQQIQSLSNLELDKIKLADISNELESLLKSKDEKNQAKGSITQKLSQNELHKSKSQSITKAIDTYQKELYRWDMLKNFIGDATGKNYANFAQELTLLQIIHLANMRLINLTDRYLLTQKNNELYVIDQYLGNIERSVKTLSGGESFVLSLALALSLSDLASQNIRLDCLFIDEGFGTLDDESLDTVISTLERLQQESDKTIGIISHVESLKERILTKIILYKNHQGLSAIQISN